MEFFLNLEAESSLKITSINIGALDALHKTLGFEV
jgi:hypothetical protein